VLVRNLSDIAAIEAVPFRARIAREHGAGSRQRRETDSRRQRGDMLPVGRPARRDLAASYCFVTMWLAAAAGVTRENARI